MMADTLMEETRSSMEETRRVLLESVDRLVVATGDEEFGKEMGALVAEATDAMDRMDRLIQDRLKRVKESELKNLVGDMQGGIRGLIATKLIVLPLYGTAPPETGSIVRLGMDLCFIADTDPENDRMSVVVMSGPVPPELLPTAWEAEVGLMDGVGRRPGGDGA